MDISELIDELQESQAIRVDRSKIRKAVDFVVKRLKVLAGRYPNQTIAQALGRNGEYRVGVYRTKDVRGKALEAPIFVVRGRSSVSKWTFVDRAGFRSRASGKGEITLDLNPNLSIDHMLANERQLRKQLASLLTHEVVHLRDVLKSKDDEKSYWSRPHEVRAYMRQIVDEVEEWAEEYAKEMGWFKADGDTLDNALRNSRIWGEFGSKFTPAGRKKIMKAVATKLSKLEPILMDKYYEPWDDDDDDWKPPSAYTQWSQRLGEAEGIEYAGERFSGYNKPKRTPSHPTKSHAVVARKDGKVRLIRFGQQGVEGAGANPSSEKQKKRQRSFKARHADDIKKGPMSAAYWADKVKW